MGKTIGVLLSVLLHLFLAGMVNSSDEVPCQVTMVLGGDDLGSQANPVKCDGIKGEEEYLTRLRDTSGRPVIYRRIGHGHVELKGKILILDKFEIKARDGSTCAEIYLYADCRGCVESEAVNGFEMGISSFTGHITYKYESRPLTAHDVYRMIIDNGFYCEAVTGSPFHDEGLSGLQKPQDSIFPLKRIVLSAERSSGMIETLSEIDRGPSKKGDKGIRLCWYPEIKECTFEKAVETTEKLNRMKAGGIEKWRIPTLKELFSIVTSEGNHFPALFDCFDKKRLFFWTATPLRKEGTVLAYDKSNKAYFVIQGVSYHTGEKYALSFSFRNTLKGKNKAFLLPVFSGKRSKSQKTAGKPAKKIKTPVSQSQPGKTKSKPAAVKTKVPGFTDKIPGFDDPAVLPPAPKKQDRTTKISPPRKSPKNKMTSKPPSDKIPGFDDVPDSKKQPVSPKKAGKAPRTVKIALFPYMLKGKLTADKERFLNDLNEEIAISLKDLNQKLKKDLNLSLVIERKDSSDPGSINEITMFYTLFSDRNLRDSERMNKIITKIMAPQSIDIIATVIHHPGGKKSFESYIINVISAVDNSIYKRNFITDKRKYGDLVDYIKKSVNKIIYSNFSTK